MSGKHNVYIFDPNIYPPSEAVEKLKLKVEQYNPDIAGISIRNIDTTDIKYPQIFYNNIKPAVSVIKSVKPDLKIIAGGSGFSMFAKEIMADIPEIEFGVFLEGEETVLELLDNLNDPGKIKGLFVRKNGEINFTGPREPPDFAKLIPPAVSPDIIDVSNYPDNFGIQAKRGCHFKCTYCTYPFLSGDKLRLRTPESVVEEMENLSKNYKVKSFTFVDSIFNFPMEHAQAICQEIIKKNLNIKWAAFFDLRNFSQELLEVALRSGCNYFMFSPDAATNEGLEILQKGITVQDIENSVTLLKGKKGIFIVYGFFVGIPKQGFKSVIKTLGLALRIKLSFGNSVKISLESIRIEPDTNIYQTAIEEGIISRTTSLIPRDEKSFRNLFCIKGPSRFLNISIIRLFPMLEDIFGMIYKLRRAITKRLVKSGNFV